MIGNQKGGEGKRERPGAIEYKDFSNVRVKSRGGKKTGRKMILWWERQG